MTSTESSHRHAQRPLKILLIRANGAATPHTRQILAGEGHIVLEAARSEEAGRILLNRPVNLILIEAAQDRHAWLDVASRLRDASGRLSARYTPIFVIADRPIDPLPDQIDGVLRAPLIAGQLLTVYLAFLSDSVNARQRSRDMARCCDVEAALERLGGDMELYKDLVDRFLDDTAGTRARIDAAIERADAKLLHTAAHSLKGLASSVGATAATAALADLEEIGLRQDLPAAAPAWRRFQAEMERTADELAPYHRRSFAGSN